MSRQLLRWLPALVIAATVLYTISVYSTLPAQMPTHWGVSGRPSGWSPRELGAWLLPGMMLFIWASSRVIPKKLGMAFDLIITAIVTFEAVIQFVMLNVALGHAVDINKVVSVGLVALFAVLGLALPFSYYWRQR